MTNILAGQQFGKLVAIEPTQQQKNGSVMWRCPMMDAPS